jgi:uroporphyrinogen-III synthase
MQENKISILTTRPLPKSLTEEILSAGIIVDTFSYIETEPIVTVEVQQEIEQVYLRSATVVFTSITAVDAVITQQEDQQPDWLIYCTEPATRKHIEHYFGKAAIVGSAGSAAELAQLIIDDGETDEVIFFCGDHSRKDLPNLLRAHDITVFEIPVYQTTMVPHKISKSYHGILFFSPSGVESFFQHNTLKDKTILFAIGATTAAEIKKYTGNKIVTSDSPDKESLVKLVLDIFGSDQ